jgi:hypothetical protein
MYHKQLPGTLRLREPRASHLGEDLFTAEIAYIPCLFREATVPVMGNRRIEDVPNRNGREN